MLFRKTRKRRLFGGNPESTFIDYATKIKNKQPIDIAEFKNFLESVEKPLKKAFEIIPGEGKKTINEYAVMYNAEMEIHASFRNYDIAINHKILYPFASSMGIGELNVLEAYILQGLHIENIRVMIEQLEKTKSLTDAILFRYLPEMDNLPTLFACSIFSSNYVNSQIHNTIYPMILNMYMGTENFKKLTHNYNSKAIIDLFKTAVKYAKPDFMISIYQKFLSPRDAYVVVFNKSVLERLMLQNNETLYLTAINMLQYSNPEFIEMIIKEFQFQDTSLFDYLKEYKIKMSSHVAKQFFSKLATQIIDNVMVPYNDSNVRIIIRSHGVSNGPGEIVIDFPFNKLCYFVEKGKQLGESCIVSRRTEELICAGNFDPNLVCTESTNGKIIVEDQLLDFHSGGVYDVEQNQFLGIYICKEGIVSRANVSINTSRSYTQLNIVEICKNICDTEEIEYSKVDVLIFACRGYAQNESDIQVIKPVVVTKKP
jgi:hypothetical protein